MTQHRDYKWEYKRKQKVCRGLLFTFQHSNLYANLAGSLDHGHYNLAQGA